MEIKEIETNDYILEIKMVPTIGFKILENLMEDGGFGDFDLLYYIYGEWFGHTSYITKLELKNLSNDNSPAIRYLYIDILKNTFHITDDYIYIDFYYEE